MLRDEFTMTTDKALKASARRIQSETGQSYTAALRQAEAERDSTISCETLAHQIWGHLLRRGWATPSTEHPLSGPYLGDADEWEVPLGPVHLTLGRDRGFVDGLGDPDDPNDYDLTQTPEVTVMFPWLQSIKAPIAGEHFTDHGFSDLNISGAQSPSRIAEQIRDLVFEGRRKGLAGLDRNTACTVCRDRWDRRHLVNFEEHSLCPMCLYDQDVWGTIHPGEFVLLHDYYYMRDSAIPSEWGPHAVLIALLNQRAGRSRHELVDSLEDKPDFGELALEHWDDPMDLWLWLPQDPRLPDYLNALRGAGRLGAVLNAIDVNHPDLRTVFAEKVWGEWTAEDDEAQPRDAAEKAAFLSQAHYAWPLLVAVVVCAELPHAIAGHRAGAWAEQIYDSHHAAALDKHFGLTNFVASDGFACVMSSAPNLAEMIAPALRD